MSFPEAVDDVSGGQARRATDERHCEPSQRVDRYVSGIGSSKPAFQATADPHPIYQRFRKALIK